MKYRMVTLDDCVYFAKRAEREREREIKKEHVVLCNPLPFFFCFYFVFCYVFHSR